MPGWLQAFSRNNPITIAVNAVRYLVLGEPWGAGADVWKALAWVVAITAFFIPLAVRRYRRAV